MKLQVKHLQCCILALPAPANRNSNRDPSTEADDTIRRAVSQACGSVIRTPSLITGLEPLRQVEEGFKGKWRGNAEVEHSEAYLTVSKDAEKGWGQTPAAVEPEDRKRVKKAGCEDQDSRSRRLEVWWMPTGFLHKTPVNTVDWGLALAFAKVQYQHLHLSL